MEAIIALSTSGFIEKYGAYAGLAAIPGLAVPPPLYFAQAREVRRLRDWAGRAPERDSEQRSNSGVHVAPTGARDPVSVVRRSPPPGAVRPAGGPATPGPAAAAPPSQAAPAKPAEEGPAAKPTHGAAPMPSAAPQTNGPGDPSNVEKPVQRPATAPAQPAPAGPSAPPAKAAPRPGAPAAATAAGAAAARASAGSAAAPRP